MIKVFTGPVKSGKSKELIKEAIKQQSLGKTILFYCGNYLKSYNDNYIQLPKEVVYMDDLNFILSQIKYNHYDCVFIDDFEQLEADLKGLQKLKLIPNTEIYISGTSMKSNLKPIPTMARLLCYADEIEILKPNCESCHEKEATLVYKRKLLINQPNQKYEIKQIPVCEDCYMNLKATKKKKGRKNKYGKY